jgi:hypothetical protein
MPEGVCRTIVKGGNISQEIIEDVSKTLRSHNFVNRLDIIVKKSDFSNVQSYLSTLPSFQKVVFNSTLLQLLNFIIQLSPDKRKDIQIVTLDRDISHDNSICITKGKLTLKLRSDIYLKSGFHFKLSALSHGNKNFHNQMYIHSFDLTNIEENVQKNSKNDVRLLWFAENIIDESFRFIITTELGGIDINKLLQNNINIIANELVVPSIKHLDNCIHPDLDIVNNKESIAEILEWLSYASLGGKDLDSEVDPYISRYSSMMEKSGQLDLSIITLNKLLISSTLHIKLTKFLFECLDWFSIISYGVKNTTRSYDNGGEHSFVDDGTNDIALLVNNNKYICWEITDSGDPHQFKK